MTINRQECNADSVNTRADASNRPIQIGKSLLAQKSSVSDAIRIWNKAPDKVTTCSSIGQAKNEIKIFVKLLPV